jgi:hypothetical protein
MSSVNSVTPLADASRIYGIPGRTLRDEISREGPPLIKLGRNAALSADTEIQLRQ